MGYETDWYEEENTIKDPKVERQKAQAIESQRDADMNEAANEVQEEKNTQVLNDYEKSRYEQSSTLDKITDSITRPETRKYVKDRTIEKIKEKAKEKAGIKEDASGKKKSIGSLASDWLLHGGAQGKAKKQGKGLSFGNMYGGGYYGGYDGSVPNSPNGSSGVRTHPALIGSGGSRSSHPALSGGSNGGIRNPMDAMRGFNDRFGGGLGNPVTRSSTKRKPATKKKPVTKKKTITKRKPQAKKKYTTRSVSRSSNPKSVYDLFGGSPFK